jgi:hypothetical protein
LPDLSFVQNTKTWTIYVPNNQKNILNGHKIDQMAEKIPIDPKICQYLQLQYPPKFTQIRMFGLNICHLATQVHSHYYILEYSLKPFKILKWSVINIFEMLPCIASNISFWTNTCVRYVEYKLCSAF